VIYLLSLIMGVVEGLTEFLPISSTGHLILAGDLLGFSSEKGKVFEIVIQTGAMLAVVWEYRRRFLSNPPWRTVAIAFLPAVVFGVLFGKYIKAHLFRPVPVALAFIIGGIVILWAERRKHEVRVKTVDEMSLLDALKVGIAQCLAMIPGTSRSGATIIGGLLFGLSRKAATEFSFFLAVPTLMGAGGYDLYKQRHLLSSADFGWFAVGMAAAFASALACVRWLIRFVSTHDFTAFAWYRIAFGLVVLATAWSGLVTWTTR
jgi:undecaprenyl-diphosphatase